MITSLVRSGGLRRQATPASAGRVVDLYRAVLIEAATQDLYAYLDERVLRRLRALLWLPAEVADAISAWADRHAPR